MSLSRRLVLGVFLCFAILFSSEGARAGDQRDCQISGIGVFGSGWYLQCDGGSRTGLPGCVNQQSQWAMSWSSPVSKQFYALAISYQALKVPVRLNGLSTCEVFSGRETINALEKNGL